MIRNDDPRHAILRELGLSEYAARAYMALLELGTTEARDVARLAKVPVAKIYSTLDQLAHKGFCVILLDTPKRFSPEPMDRVMKRIAQAHLDDAAKADARATELAALFPVSPKDHASDRGSAIILRGRHASLDKARQLASEAKDVTILASDHFMEREGRHLSSGVDGSHRLLLVERADGETLVESVPTGVDVRILPNMRGAPHAVSMRLYDDQAILLTHHVPDDRSEHAGQDVSILILEQAIVRALSDVIELAWRGGATASAGAASAAVPTPSLRQPRSGQ